MFGWVSSYIEVGVGVHDVRRAAHAQLVGAAAGARREGAAARARRAHRAAQRTEVQPARHADYRHCQTTLECWTGKRKSEPKYLCFNFISIFWIYIEFSESAVDLDNKLTVPNNGTLYYSSALYNI